MMATSRPLTATRRRLPPGTEIDPWALAGPTGILFDAGDRLLVGIGSALVIPLETGLDSPTDLDRVRRTLAAVAGEDPDGGSGSPVLAFGALPFDRSERTTLVVPEVIYERRTDGEQWVTVVGRPFAGDPGDELAAGRRDPSAPAIEPGAEEAVALRGADVRALSSEAEFRDIVAEAVAAIGRGELTKVVLARQVDVDFERPVDIPALLRRWRTLEPNCTVFSMPSPKGQFVGASPELLLERHGDQVYSRPLAGTTGLLSDADAAEFRASTKESLEHRLVAEAIAAALTPLCTEVDLPPGPELVRLHTIIHLGTAIYGKLRRRPTPDGDEMLPTALDLVAALHPTPAVGGVPTQRAVDTIAKLEPDLRGAYAGPVGYVDGDGDGQWVVGIRAATLRAATARLAAGVGIVSGSEPWAELAETTLKFTAVFDALAPGLPFATPRLRSALPAIP
jgi:menaquinone-specific isochorismate synthase